MTTQFQRPPSEAEAPRDRDRGAGAISVRGRPVRKAPLAWVPWVAIGLLALLAITSVLVARNAASTDVDVDAVTPTPAPAPEAPPLAPASGESTVVAGGRALLPIPGAGLASLVGQKAEGRAVLVQSVVADEGFWVGDDTTNRIFVFLTDDAKVADGESPFRVEAGQRVDFEGTVEAIPDDLPPFGLEPAEGAEQLRQQGYYLELTEVAISG